MLAEPVATKSNPTVGYIAVQLPMLRRLQYSAVDLFVHYDPQLDPVLYHRASRPLAAEELAKLQQISIEHVYVRTDDLERFGAHLLQSVDSVAAQEEIGGAENLAALQLAFAADIERVARFVDCGPFVAVAQQVAKRLTEILCTKNVLPRDLFRLARHDFNTFTHATNVANYAVILADRLGWCDGDGLEEIATAAILHDIGKRFIPSSILTKTTRLESQERAIIESHPQRGYEELCERSDLSFEQLLTVYQHHERMDGSGYPVGLMNEEIHPWARMLAVVDVFDAMTGIRPYRRPASVKEAMIYIRERAGTHFDPEVVACWDAAMRTS